MVKPLAKNIHLCVLERSSIGFRQPVHGVNLLLDPGGDRDGRCVQVLLLFKLLSCIDCPAVERWDIIKNKRHKRNKRKG